MRETIKLVIEEGVVKAVVTPVPPYLEGEYLVKANRVVLGPIDILLSMGLLSSKNMFIGSLACGRVVEPQGIESGTRVYVHPKDPLSTPPLTHDGVALGVFRARNKILETPPHWVNSPELSFLYSSAQNAFFECTGKILLVGGSGLHGLMLQSILPEDSMVYCPEGRAHKKLRLLRKENIGKISWDTIVVWTIKQHIVCDVIAEISKNENNPKLIVNPYASLILNLNMQRIVKKSMKVIVPWWKGELEAELVRKMENETYKSGLLMRLRLDDLPAKVCSSYMVVEMCEN